MMRWIFTIVTIAANHNFGVSFHITFKALDLLLRWIENEISHIHTKYKFGLVLLNLNLNQLIDSILAESTSP